MGLQSSPPSSLSAKQLQLSYGPLFIVLLEQ